MAKGSSSGQVLRACAFFSHLRTLTLMYINIYIYIYISVYKIYIYIYTQQWLYIYIYIYISSEKMCVCVYISTYIYIYSAVEKCTTGPLRLTDCNHSSGGIQGQPCTLKPTPHKGRWLLHLIPLYPPDTPMRTPNICPIKPKPYLKRSPTRKTYTLKPSSLNLIGHWASPFPLPDAGLSGLWWRV